MNPEAKAKRKIGALERRRALIDTLIEFIRTHPNAVDGADLHPMGQGTGLHYDFAVIRPRWDKGKNGVVLRLEKWFDGEDPSERYEVSEGMMTISKRFIVSEDVRNVSDDKLSQMLEDIHNQLIPEDFAEDGARQN